MSSIKIIAAPPGQAPQWVRNAWIGVVIPLPQQVSGGVQMGVRGGKAENTGGYQVNARDAINELRKQSPKAANWWRTGVPIRENTQLVFSKSVCELIP